MINRGKMPRQLRNKGGITNVTPRTNFFLGGIKKRLRKLIPNELSGIATAAAPFVAPFNPAIAAAMAGIGGFDRTGRIGSSLKSAALTYGGGQLARQLGGADLQGNPFKQGGAFRGGLEGLKSGFSSPLSTGNMEKVFGKASVKGVPDAISGGGTEGILSKLGLTEGAGSLKLTGLGKISAASLASYFVAKGATPDEAKNLAKDVYRGKGIGFDQIRADLEKYKSGEFSQADMFDKNYRFLTPRSFLAKDGGRTNLQEGSDPGPMGNPAVMKKIENMREERIMNPDVEDVADYLTFYKNKKKQDEEIKRMLKKKKSKKDIFKRDTPLTEDLLGLSKGFTLSPVTLLRRFLAKKELEKKSKKANGGIMSMPTGKMRKNSAGVMERDYRDEGGFVPVGVKEKADDVPAMLSKNEFVMTADAVRGAGNGSIDKGAQKMYNTMKRLEGMVK